MNERLAFSAGSLRPETVLAPPPPRRARTDDETSAHPAPAVRTRRRRERVDLAYWSLLAFTALLFVRPQDTFPFLQRLHLPDLTALAAVAGVGVGVMRGRIRLDWHPVTLGILTVGGIGIVMAPFSVWPGGSIATITDLWLKIFIIFTVMALTLTDVRRVHQFVWIMVVASGYIALRGTWDYINGNNLGSTGRLRGPVGGIFGNPNDLALNMVVFLPFATLFAVSARRAWQRLSAAGFAVLMLATVFFTQSRSGFVGLVAAGLTVVALARPLRRRALVLPLVLLLVAPLAPDTFWNRMSSIFEPERDEVGSRQSRIDLMHEGLDAFLDRPLTGVGAGQFVNYNPEGRLHAWDVTHNVWLQVAAELGIFGLLAFGFVVWRGTADSFASFRRVDRNLIRPRKGRHGPDEPARVIAPIAYALPGAMVGWLVCAFFASVAFNWTLYYLLGVATSTQLVTRNPNVRSTGVRVRPEAA